MNVIGSLLLGGKKAFLEVAHKLKPEHFYSDLYRDCYKIISELQFKDNEVDLPILKDKLISKGWRAEEIDKWLMQGMEIVVTTALIGGNADVIINNYKAREAYKLLKSTELHADGIDEQLTDLTSKLNDLKQDTGKRKTQLISDFLLPVYETFFEERDPRTVYTGFSKLDAIIGGIEPTDYCLIAARPGVGKTESQRTFCSTLQSKAKSPHCSHLKCQRNKS